LDQLNAEQKQAVNKYFDVFYSDSSARFEDETKFNFLINYCLDTTIQFMKETTISYFNVLTKSQISFKSDKPFPENIE